MHRHNWRVCWGLLLAAGCMAQNAGPVRALSWQDTQDKFRANNPTLLAGQELIDESRANEITAFLRPNPDISINWDQLTPFNFGPYRPFSQSYAYGVLSYLHEREHKRELRLLSAQKATSISIATQHDLERNLLFSLRDAFVRVLLAKAVREVARNNLAYWDKEIGINLERLNAGGLARVDYQRVELQRVQFVSDLETSEVNLRTAKIDLEALLRDRTPVEQFDVTASFDFKDALSPLEDVRKLALDLRPDLKSAEESVDKARTDHQLAIANGSSDPTFSIDISHQPNPLNTYVGGGVNFPLRIFDRNQGEKIRTQIDISRNEKLRDVAEIAVLRDVDSAYTSLLSTLALLRPYKTKYLQEALDVRSTITFSYLHGGASLLDFLDAQKEYRDIELNYLNLVGSYFSAANQLNFAVGREVIR